MQPRPTLAFGDDGSPAADVCWLWINSHTWPGWQLLTKPPWIGSVDVTILVVNVGRTDTTNTNAATMARCELEKVDFQPGILNLDGKPTAASVALGTRGLTGIQRLHHGSTACGIARAARCSVLLACAETPTPSSPPDQ